MKKYWAELIGTFILVFAGTGAIVINELYGSVTHLGVGLNFWLSSDGCYLFHWRNFRCTT